MQKDINITHYSDGECGCLCSPLLFRYLFQPCFMGMVSESDEVIAWFVMTCHDNYVMINNMFCHEMSPHIIICHKMSPNIIMWCNVTMLSWKIFHDIWHEPDENFDRVLPSICHEMSFNLTWWHLMTWLSYGIIMMWSIRFREAWFRFPLHPKLPQNSLVYIHSEKRYTKTVPLGYYTDFAVQTYGPAQQRG